MSEWEAIKSAGLLVYWRKGLPSGAYFAVSKNGGIGQPAGQEPDDGRWRWQLRGPDLNPDRTKTVHASGTRSTSRLAMVAADRFLYVRPCAVCGGACRWSEDAWVCKRCGDEWYPDSGHPYDLFPEEPRVLS